MSNVKIQTSQNVSLEFEPASIGDRILASILDSLVMIAYALIIFFIFIYSSINRFNQNVAQDSSENLAFVITIIILIVLPLMFYHLLSEIFMNGQSIGKRAMNIRVVMLNGGTPTLGAYFIRWIFRIIDIQLFSGLVAIVAIASNQKGQRLGDMAAGTTVVKMKQRISLDSLKQVEVSADYEMTFPQVEKLTDKDMEVVRSVMQNYYTSGNVELVFQAADKIKSLLGVTSNLEDLKFLQTIEQDYSYWANSRP